MARALRTLLILVVVVGIAVGIAVAASVLPSGTRTGALIARAVIGLSIGLVGVFIVRRMLRALVEPPPPAPPTVDARASDVIYECLVCGTRVRLEVAATTKPPRHCGEEMESRLG